MIDTLAKRAASSRFALGGSSIRPPSGTFTQIERGYTLGLYTFTSADVPFLSLDFTGANAATGTLTAMSATATLTAYTATGTLVVIEVEQ